MSENIDQQYPTPQRDRMRRSARYAVSDPSSENHQAVIPAEALIQRSRSGRQSIEGGSSVQEDQRSNSWSIPHALMWPAVGAFMLALVLLVAGIFMNVYLKNQETAREKAYARLVDAHPLDYRSLIELYAAENNLQPALVTAIILNESSFRTRAESNVGARGLMQLMEETAGWIAGKLHLTQYSFQDLWDPETNIRFGCWYLGWLSEKYSGDPVCVISAYHAGQGEVNGWLSGGYSSDGRTLQLDELPPGNTRVYAERVTRDYAIYDALYYHSLNPAADDSSDPISVSGSGWPG